MNIALILAGGQGNRTAQDIPKQFMNVYDKPLIIYTLENFEKHPDIAGEFEYWIANNQYCEGVCVEGYTAKAIAELSPFMDGEGAFMLLIELSENPDKAKQRIAAGFKLK